MEGLKGKKGAGSLRFKVKIFPPQMGSCCTQPFIITSHSDMTEILLTLKRQTKNVADDTLFFYFYLSKEIRLDVSRESFA